MNVMVPPEYMAAAKELTAALQAELDAVRLCPGSNQWREAHEAAMAAKARLDELEPDWMRQRVGHDRHGVE